VRRPKGDLVAYWDPSPVRGTDPKTGRRGDVVFSTTDGESAVDGRRLLYHAFSIVDIHGGKCLLDELEARGFDITTIRFSIDRKAKSP
jgi:hypothetical protein